MDPEFEKLLAGRDATAQPPRRSEGGSGPSISDLLGSGLNILGQAVTGLPGAVVRLAQDFQRNPLGFTPVGDIQTLMESSDAYARGDIGEGALGTALASLGLLGVPLPVGEARRVARVFMDHFKLDRDAIGSQLSSEDAISQLPNLLRGTSVLTGRQRFVDMEEAISGLPSDELRRLVFNEQGGAITDLLLRTKKHTEPRLAADLLHSQAGAELAARTLTGDEVARRAFEETDDGLSDDLWAQIDAGILSYDDAVENFVEQEPTVDYDEVNKILEYHLSQIPWMKAVLNFTSEP